MVVLVLLALLCLVLGALQNLPTSSREPAPALLPPRPVAATVRFERQLDLGLRLEHSRGETPGIGSVRAADEIGRALRLLSREVRAALDRAARAGDVVVTDMAVAVAVPRDADASVFERAREAVQSLAQAIEEARPDMKPAACVADMVPAFEAIARSSAGAITHCPLSVRALARGVPVVLTAERVARECFQLRIDVTFAPAGAHGRLSAHTLYTIEALVRSLRGCARARLRDDGTLTLFLDGAPHTDVLAGVIQRVLGAATEVTERELSQATPYRDSPGSGRARAA